MLMDKKSWKLDPQQPTSDETGQTWRSYTLDGQEFFFLNLSVMVGDNQDNIKMELERFCKAIKEKTGIVVAPEDLPTIIKNRKIEE